MFYMHVHGHGSPAELARKVKPALDLIGKGTSRPPAAAAAPAAAPTSAVDTAKIAQIAGHQGEQNGAVYKITVGCDDLKLTEMGAPINARMGLNTWAAFVGTNDNAPSSRVLVERDAARVLEHSPEIVRRGHADAILAGLHRDGAQPRLFESIVLSRMKICTGTSDESFR